MRLFFDSRFTRTDRHDGISRYGAELLRALLDLTRGTDVEVTAIINDPAQLAMLPQTRYVLLNDPISPAEPFIARRLNDLGADVVFSTMQVMGSTGRHYKLILTLHDLIYYDHPTPPRDLPGVVRGAWRLYHKAYWPQRVLLNRADAVATVSRTTAELIAEHRLTRKPVQVIGNAATPPAALPQRAPGDTAKSLVYMGAFMPYKNVETIARAMPLLPGWTLHLTSKISPVREAELARLAGPAAHIEFHHGVSDEEYHRLLDSATALVSASRAEGFGLPVVEALSRGLPVLLSELPIFREIAGPAGVYFDPDSPRSLAAGARRLADAETWLRLSKLAPRQAATFSWDESARRLLDLARELTNG